MAEVGAEGFDGFVAGAFFYRTVGVSGGSGEMEEGERVGFWNHEGRFGSVWV